MSDGRAERAHQVAQPFLTSLDRHRRREVLDSARQLLREHGPEGLLSDPGAVPKMTRAQVRQMYRALGWRGSKAHRHNLDRQRKRVAQALALDQALTAADAEARMGPIEHARYRIREAVS